MRLQLRLSESPNIYCQSARAPLYFSKQAHDTDSHIFQNYGVTMPEHRSHRLPTTVTPERYAIRLTPDLTTWTFAGEETVTLRLHRAVHEIVLNATELEIHSVAIKDANGRVSQGSIAFDHENEQARFTFPFDLSPGQGELAVKFSGI